MKLSTSLALTTGKFYFCEGTLAASSTVPTRPSWARPMGPGPFGPIFGPGPLGGFWPSPFESNFGPFLARALWAQFWALAHLGAFLGLFF